MAGNGRNVCKLLDKTGKRMCCFDKNEKILLKQINIIFKILV